MIEIQGKNNSAKVFTEVMDDVSKEQIKTLCNQDFIKDSHKRSVVVITLSKLTEMTTVIYIWWFTPVAVILANKLRNIIRKKPINI